VKSFWRPQEREKTMTTLFRRLRILFRNILHFPERLSHRRRREAALSQIAALREVKRILVVCTGNICRSPYFAAVLRERLPNARIASAGFVGFNRAVPEHALNTAASRGIDLSGFRSRLLDPRRARSADLVVVMEARQASYLSNYYGVPRRRVLIAGDLDPKTAPTRSIEDPWRESVEIFTSSFDRIDRCADALAGILTAAAGLPATTDDREVRTIGRHTPPAPMPQPIL